MASDLSVARLLQSVAQRFAPGRPDGEPASEAQAVRGDDFFWTSLTFLGLYRLLVASVIVGLIVLGGRSAFGIGEEDPRLFLLASLGYLALAIAGLVTARRIHVYGPVQLTCGVLVDVAAFVILMYASGGFRSGLAIMILLALGGAAMLADRTMMLFHASIASIAVLGSESLWVARGDVQIGGFLQPGLLSIGYFAISVMVNSLAERVIRNERVARERGVELESQLRVNESVIQYVQDGVLVIDSDEKVRLANRAASAEIGQAAVTGKALRELSPALAARLAEWKANPRRRLDEVVFPVSGRRGRPRFQSVGVAGQRLVLVFLEDLSRLEDEARQLKLVALGRLTANIAHEIRNPLSAITHAADLMTEENRAEGRTRLSQIMRDNARRLDRMVGDIMELARRDRADREPIDLSTYLSVFADEFTQYEKLPQGSVRLEVPRGAIVQCDRVHLNQVLWNLVRNAWRHGRQRPGSVAIEVHAGPDRIEMDVVDDGPGVSEAIRAQLFEPFFTTYSKGTGLGLYIARELTTANGAELDYVPGSGGARFRMRWISDTEPEHEAGASFEPQ
jgi:two-component system sensor histidine kinase PilS (NtrC family)